MTTGAVLAPEAESEQPQQHERPEPTSPARWWDQLITALVVVLPLVVLGLSIWLFWHHGIGWFDLGLGAALYVITGLGLSLGFHRLFTHRSFRARRPLRIALGVAGSMAVEGSLISWVSHHRRHHVYADQAGDPHSPWTVDRGDFRRLRGLFHAHVGWLFSGAQSSPKRWSRDLLGDRDVVAISNLAPLWMALSLALPFALGYAITAFPRGCDPRPGVGRPGAYRAPAPCDVECQLAWAHVRQAPLPERRSQWEHRLAECRQFRRLLAQLAPRLPRARRAMAVTAVSSILRRASSGCSRASVGPRRSSVLPRRC